MNIMIRQELEKDYNWIEEVVKQAFLNGEYSDQKEHELVNRIRKSDAFIPELSLVAVDKEIVGHILLSKIKIEHDDKFVDSLALAPVSVAPDYQKKGIGRLLISGALRKARELGYHSVIVLGHKDYYPKFGFKPASLWNIRAPFEVPDEVFMAMELTDHALQNIQGVVQYSEAFSE
ncbi:GNAT family N-acetyltransferase [Bacillus gaemokensis]|uniref:GCN5 family acetyltransferase n=1 Tax=Bacillus gaemokensis TaxID=574375 RepID=A0A073KK26_9BACI|nr:N-acetyltransferase [Bacillus gaemokensis]KEK22688.1 GCN5 family acetyltransferase [Bacillus gaemokensis]KYG28888.1 GCN5 family acetyltransferase [Bacillus gaemokensis]